jgi:hypothetical protein
MNKRERKPTNTKDPKPSPNRRATKELRLAEQDEKTKQTDVEMSEKQDLENPPPVDQDSDWKRWSLEHNGWIFEKTPGPTEAWGKISAAKKTAAQGFMKMDLETIKWNLKLKDGWRDIQKIYKVDGKLSSKEIPNAIPFGDKLSRAMQKDMPTMFSTKHAKSFRCMMAFSKTDISFLPGVAFDSGSTLIPSSIIAELWIAGVNLFGSNTIEERRPTVFVEGQSIIPTSKLWKETDTSKIIGYTTDTLFSDENDGAHDMCRRTKNMFLKNGHSKHQWKQLFLDLATQISARTSEEENALHLALKMARTNPRVLTGWVGNNLEENEITAAWAGAYEVLGGAWIDVRFSDDTPPSSPPKVSSTLKAPRYSKPGQETLTEAPTPVVPKIIINPYYVVKKAPEPPKTKHKKKTYMQTTYKNPIELLMEQPNKLVPGSLERSPDGMGTGH